MSDTTALHADHGAATVTSSAAASLVDQLTVAKTLAMLVLGLGSFVLGVVPLKLTKWWRSAPSGASSSASSGSSSSASSSTGGHHHHHHHHSHAGESATGSPVVSLLLCFGGGVLLFTTLLHLQPEVREGVARLQRAGLLPERPDHLGDLIFCAGFFMVFIVDEIVHSVLDRYYAATGRVGGSGDSAEDVLHRSMSLRRRSMSIPRASLSGSPGSVPSVTGGASTASIKELLKESGGGSGKQKRYHQHHMHHHQSTGPWAASPEVMHNGHDQQHQQQYHHHHMHHHGSDVEKQHQQTKSEADSGGGGDGGGGGGDHSLRGLFAVLALSFHEVFEGLAIGLEERLDNVWYLFLAVATHKLVIAFCIGLELAWSKTRRPVLVVYVATFAVVTPVGIAIGMGIVHFGGAGGSLDGTPGRVSVVLQGLAAGTLLYVVFFEVLARHKQSGFLHLLSIMVGFGVLLALQMMTHHHSHGGSPSAGGDDHQSADHHHHPADHNHSDHDHSSHDHHGHDH